MKRWAYLHKDKRMNKAPPIMSGSRLSQESERERKRENSRARIYQNLHKKYASYTYILYT